MHCTNCMNNYAIMLITSLITIGSDNSLASPRHAFH